MIQSPYLRKIGKKRFAVSAKLYVELSRRRLPQRYGKKLRQDVVHFRVSVAKRRLDAQAPAPHQPASAVGLAASTDKTVKVTDRGVIAVQQKLGKRSRGSCGRPLQTAQGRRGGVRVTLEGYVPPFPGVGFEAGHRRRPSPPEGLQAVTEASPPVGTSDTPGDHRQEGAPSPAT